VSPADTNAYKITTAIGEAHLGTISDSQKFGGVLYPSVRMFANGDNIALLPWFVDRHVEFRKAVHVRIENKEDNKFSITYLDSAKALDADGKLIWLGRMPNFTLNRPFQKAQLTLTLGQDEDGDYTISQDGHPCHWVAIDADTGELIPAQ
jgi:hypothetical protein